jgi:hypothetical protein
VCELHRHRRGPCALALAGEESQLGQPVGVEARVVDDPQTDVALQSLPLGCVLQPFLGDVRSGLDIGRLVEEAELVPRGVEELPVRGDDRLPADQDLDLVILGLAGSEQLAVQRFGGHAGHLDLAQPLGLEVVDHVEQR